jgi:acyl-CoA thioester hydrolase
MEANHNSTRVRVRYAETDQMGVVYHANYLVWFEIGRTELLSAMGLPYDKLESEEGLNLPVAEANCRYRQSARYGDDVRIETCATVLRPSVIRFDYQAKRVSDDALLAEGHTIHMVCDHERKRHPLPEKYLAALRQK